jgi:hypothetical protein
MKVASGYNQRCRQFTKIGVKLQFFVQTLAMSTFTTAQGRKAAAICRLDIVNNLASVFRQARALELIRACRAGWNVNLGFRLMIWDTAKTMPFI